MAERSLYLDDLRTPPKKTKWDCVARNTREAIAYFDSEGCPDYISFDHDLGEKEPTGFDLAKLMVNRDLDSNYGFIPAVFRFHVHSANPVGRVNIQSLLDSYLSHRRKEIDRMVHMTHCNLDDYIGSCKYGEEDTCPALKGKPNV